MIKSLWLKVAWNVLLMNTAILQIYMHHDKIRIKYN